MSLTLLVMAAGMGSRFGGLKQLSPINSYKETIIDYSVFDAKRAGFSKVVFVIRKEFEKEFKKQVTTKYNNQIDVDFVFQDTQNLPLDFTSSKRTKPWGTGHAIWSARNVVTTNFAVINADDFYGRNSFIIMAKYLSSLKKEDLSKQCMVGYSIENTLSTNGSVSRGICEVDHNNNLTSITERTNIIKKEDHTIVYLENNTETVLKSNEIASMNMFGLTPAIFSSFEEGFISFLRENIHELKSEFYLPFVLNNLVVKSKSSVKVLPTNSKWFGMTYKEDKEVVENNIKELTSSGEYPKQLWNL